MLAPPHKFHNEYRNYKLLDDKYLFTIAVDLCTRISDDKKIRIVYERIT